jgi:hypothetical protein
MASSGRKRSLSGPCTSTPSKRKKYVCKYQYFWEKDFKEFTWLKKSLHSFGSDFVKWSASEKGKLCSATKLLNNVSDNITLDDFLSTKMVTRLCM